MVFICIHKVFPRKIACLQSNALIFICQNKNCHMSHLTSKQDIQKNAQNFRFSPFRFGSKIRDQKSDASSSWRQWAVDRSLDHREKCAASPWTYHLVALRTAPLVFRTSPLLMANLNLATVAHRSIHTMDRSSLAIIQGADPAVNRCHSTNQVCTLRFQYDSVN